MNEVITIQFYNQIFINRKLLENDINDTYKLLYSEDLNFEELDFEIFKSKILSIASFKNFSKQSLQSLFKNINQVEFSQLLPFENFVQNFFNLYTQKLILPIT